jgi:ABC-type glutathione transport system ATPase component
MTLLAVRQLGKSFVDGAGFLGLVRRRVEVVRGVGFDIDAGQTLALIGESGAGKSTTARLVLRLIEPDTGSIQFNGIDLRRLSPRAMKQMRAQIQMVFQDPYGSLDPRVQIGDSVGEPLRVHTLLSKSERDREVVALLERVGLGAPYMRRYPRELSGGQLQRAAIARALTTRPRLIVCDEPVAALDVIIRAQVIDLMKELQAELGTAYLFITHDLGLVRRFANSMAVMRHGEIVDRGTVEDLFARPGHPYTRELMEAVPKLVPKSRREAEAGGTGGAFH